MHSNVGTLRRETNGGIVIPNLTMNKLVNILVLVVAAEHVGILILEMFFWNHSFGQRIFGMTAEVSAASEVLAANQGLYNGFLAAGLFWGVITVRRDIKVFFLVCVVIAGIFGGLTAKTTIVFTQALPAFLTLILVVLQRENRTFRNI